MIFQILKKVNYTTIYLYEKSKLYYYLLTTILFTYCIELFNFFRNGKTLEFITVVAIDS